MAWEHELANELKKRNKKARQKSTYESTVFFGNIEQTSPLIISIEGGEFMYEDSEDEISMTKTFKARTQETTFAAGLSVICLPTEDMTRIVAVDLEVE